MLKKSVCLFRKNKENGCKDCIILDACPYSDFFESNASSENSGRMNKATNYPHPYSISFGFNYPSVFKDGDTFTVILSIFGKGIKYIPYFINSFNMLGENGIGKSRGRFVLQKIINSVNSRPVYTAVDGIDETAVSPVLYHEHEEVKNISLSFLTPCKIKDESRLLRKADFTPIIKNIMRRIENISSFYGTGNSFLDRKEAIEKAGNIKKVTEDTRWIRFDRYSQRQGEKMPMEGFTGYAVFSGELTPFYNYLKFGEYANIGKNTSFGFGSIKTEIL